MHLIFFICRHSTCSIIFLGRTWTNWYAQIVLWITIRTNHFLFLFLIRCYHPLLHGERCERTCLARLGNFSPLNTHKHFTAVFTISVHRMCIRIRLLLLLASSHTTITWWETPSESSLGQMTSLISCRGNNRKSKQKKKQGEAKKRQEEARS